MKKKLLATILAVCLVLSMSATAFAADGDEPTAPTAGTAEVTHDGTNFKTENDHDDQPLLTDNNGADIAVWAQIVGGEGEGAPINYKLDVAWGTMQFEFNRGAGGTWNTELHQYDGVGTGNWTPSYIDSTNNKITVTNHSNSAIDVSLASTLDNDAFNGTAGADAVVGNFFNTNAEALDAALVLTDVATGVTNTLTGDRFLLETAEAYGDGISAVNNVAADARTKDVFFAFSGTPDANISKDTFAKVGTILVSFVSNNKEYEPPVA